MINIFFAHVTCFNMFQKSRNIEIIAIRTVFYLLSCYPFVKSSTISNDVASLKKNISFGVQVLKQQSMFLSSIKFEKDYLYWSLKKKCTFFVLKIPIQSIKATKYALFNNTFIAFQTFIVQNLSHILRSRSKWTYPPLHLGRTYATNIIYALYFVENPFVHTYQVWWNIICHFQTTLSNGKRFNIFNIRFILFPVFCNC